VTRTHVRVLETRSIPEVPSPIYHEGHVYLVKNGGILTCVNTQTGKRVYRKRIGPAGTYYASPILAGHRLYISSGGGRVTVIDVAAKTPRVLAQNEFGENIFATPAIVDDTLYLRTEQSLYAIASP
jgi:outer membrane protein assembly factor BamB